MGRFSAGLTGLVFGVAVLVFVFAALDQRATDHDLYGTQAMEHFLVAAVCGVISGTAMTFSIWRRRGAATPQPPTNLRAYPW